MAEKVQTKIGSQAEAEKLAGHDAGYGSDHKAFRRQAALAILSAYVQRHGGLGSELECRENARMVWRFTDVFLSMEDAGEPTPEVAAPAPPKKRPVGPDDEWGVRDGDRMRRGFVTEEEAEAYAAGKPGAKVVQVSGKGAAALTVAPSNVAPEFA